MRKFGFVVAAVLLLTAMGALEVAAAPQQELPDVYFIEGLVGHGQTYPLSCESRSAADLAGYWGLSVGEVAFFDSLPTSDNPELGFVGSVYGVWGQTPPNPYGVHAKPIAAHLREYGLNAKAHRGMTIEQLKKEIAAGRPVIVWVVGHVWKGVPIEYTANDGSTVIVAQYEHTMIAYGYDLAGVYLMDAGSAARKGYSYTVFEDSWGVLGNLAVTANGQIKDQPPAPTKPFLEEGQYLVQEGDYIVKLAVEWGMDYKELAELNGLEYPYLIFPGDIILNGQGAQTVSQVSDSQSTPEPITTPEPTGSLEPAGSPEPTATPTAGPEVEESEYAVQSGDHLMKIARALEIDWEVLADLNDLAWPYILYPGQVLTLPGGIVNNQPAVETETEMPDDTADSEFSGETYVIQPGEYLYVLAKRFGVSWQVLAAHNGIGYPYIVFPGQLIEIP